MMVVILDDDEVSVRNHQVFAIDLVEDIGLEHISGRPGSEEPGFEKNQSIHPRPDHINVVCNKENG